MLQWLCAMLMAVAWVIPPGQEAQLQQMLTPGPQWPSGWQLVSAQVQQDLVIASYRRGQEPVVQVKLQHPDAAAVGALRTPTVAVDAGLLPEDAQAALLAQVKQQAGSWLWQAAAQAAPVGQPTAVTPTGGGLPSGRDPELQPAALLAALAQSERLPPLQRAQAQVAIAWQFKRLGTGQDRELFQRHVGFAGQSAESALVRWSAQLGSLAQASPLDPTTAASGVTLCQAATQVADDVQQGGQVRAALGLVAEVVRRDPTCRPAALMAAHFAQIVGSPELAIQALKPLLAAHPGDLELAVTMANLERQADRLDQALQRLVELDLAKVPPGSPLVLPVTRVLIDAVGAQLPAALEFTVKITAQSDRDPTDSTAAFIAGTILHHSGDWQASNGYLVRSEKAFSSEPRQFLYTAMNHFHLGEVAEAERRVTHAFRMGTQDPDVWYCRAMIFGRSQPRQSLADLGNYLAAVKGTADNPARKSAYVVKVMNDLQACQDAGDVGRCLDLRGGRAWLADHWYGLVAAAALCTAACWLWWRRRAARHLASPSLLMVLAAAGLATAVLAASPEQALALPGVRETAAPKTLEAQLSWHSPNELLQASLGFAFLCGSALFFCPLAAPSSRPSASCRDVS